MILFECNDIHQMAALFKTAASTTHQVAGHVGSDSLHHLDTARTSRTCCFQQHPGSTCKSAEKTAKHFDVNILQLRNQTEQLCLLYWARQIVLTTQRSLVGKYTAVNTHFDFNCICKDHNFEFSTKPASSC